jgi:hypothetical protein
MDKLSYEDWRATHAASMTDEAVNSLREFHGLDANVEFEKMLRSDYEFYINDEVDRQTTK